MSSADELAGLVAAAVQVAEQAGKDVADVPLATIAQAAGVSRSTLVRRLNGSRQALDEAVRAAGIDPGGRPVRVRAIEAGAQLVSDRGLANVTLESVAEAAACSVHSLYAIFGTRDELFAAIYERYSPLNDVLQLSADASTSLEASVAEFYRTLAGTLTREPRVAVAMLSDLGQPAGDCGAHLRPLLPSCESVVGRLAAGAREGGADPRHSGSSADPAAGRPAGGACSDATRDRSRSRSREGVRGVHRRVLARGRPASAAPGGELG